MINIPALLATEKLQPNKASYATFKVLMEEHAVSKGLTGYLNGTTTKPALVTGMAAPPAPTSIFSEDPSCDEWVYRDGAMKSMIVTNIVDSIGLGVKRDGTMETRSTTLISAVAGDVMTDGLSSRLIRTPEQR
jgi:hypothetical protein